MDEQRGGGDKKKREFIQSILLTQEQHFVVDFRERGEKKQDVVG